MYGPSLHLYLVGIQILCMVQAFISILLGYRYYVWSKNSSLSSGDTATMHGPSLHLLPNFSFTSFQGSTETGILCRLISVLAFAFADKYILPKCHVLAHLNLSYSPIRISTLYQKCHVLGHLSLRYSHMRIYVLCTEMACAG